jgi:tetratricopeptide (TPR) repeat protein
MTLDTSLLQLEQADLLQRLDETADQVGAAYLFKHVLTQDAAYQTLLLKQRRAFHRRVGETIEHHYPDRLEEFYAELAFHYHEGQDDAKALDYSILAGDAAFHLSANAEAISHYSRAVEILRQGPHWTQNDEKLFLNLGRTYELSQQFHEAVRIYEELVEMGKARGDQAMVLAGLAANAILRITLTPEHEPVLGEKLAREALELARVLGDRVAESKVLWVLLLLGWVHRWDADLLTYGEQSLAIAREMSLTEQIALTLGDLAFAYGSQARLADMLAALEEARTIWKKMGNLPMQANNLNVVTIPQFILGEYDRAMEGGLESIQLSKPIGNLWSELSGWLLSGMVALEYGEYGKAMEMMSEAVRLADRGNLHYQSSLAVTIYAWSCALFGATELGKERIHGSLNVFDFVTGDIRVWVLGMMAVISIAAGDLDQADAYLKEAEPGFNRKYLALYSPLHFLVASTRLAHARKNYSEAIAFADDLINLREEAGARLFISDAYFHKAEALFALGEAKSAQATLLSAREEAQSLNCRRVLWQIDALLARVDEPNSNEHRQHAAETVRFIADHTEEPALREPFLQLAAAHGILLGEIE